MRLAPIKADETMSSLDFLTNIINPARIQAGQSSIRNSDFVSRIEDELDDLPVAKFSQPTRGGTPSRYYELTFEQMTLVGMRESKAVRRSVLAKLKNMFVPSIPQTLPEALRLAAELVEQKQQLEHQLAIAAPKAEFVDNYVDASGLMTFRQVAKILDAKENYLSSFLIDNEIMYRLNGSLTAHQNHINAGRFATKAGESPSNGHAYVQTFFTSKGVHWLAGLLASEKLRDVLP